MKAQTCAEKLATTNSCTFLLLLFFLRFWLCKLFYELVTHSILKAFLYKKKFNI